MRSRHSEQFLLSALAVLMCAPPIIGAKSGVLTERTAEALFYFLLGLLIFGTSRAIDARGWSFKMGFSPYEKFERSENPTLFKVRCFVGYFFGGCLMLWSLLYFFIAAMPGPPKVL